jgi:hypothetical protein
MKRIIATLVCAIVVVPLLQVAARAGALQRTYVSGSGRDSTSCTATSPCKNLQTALNHTLAGGEIIVLDSANYGAVTITKSLSITSDGAVAGMLATRGAAITINAGANDVINLRGLDIDGGYSGTVGIQFNSGRSLNIQKATIRGFTNAGISFTPNGASALFVSDTVINGNKNTGILVSAGGAVAVNGVLNRISASRNGVGILANGSSAKLTIADTVSGNNTYGVGANSAAVIIRNSTLSNNTVGVAADQSATVRIGQSTVTANATGWISTNGGQVLSYGNNNVSGNTSDGTLSSTVALQ